MVEVIVMLIVGVLVSVGFAVLSEQKHFNRIPVAVYLALAGAAGFICAAIIDQLI